MTGLRLEREGIKMGKEEVCKYPLTEGSDPKVSTLNCLHLSNVHGAIVGVIHQITPRMIQNTFVFYHDGYVHVARGFRVGPITEQSKGGICGLYTILNLIPFLAPHILINLESKDDVPDGCVDITLIGLPQTPETPEELEKNYTSIFHIFRLPSETPEEISECDGLRTLDSQVYYLAQDKHSVIEEGQW